MALLFQQSLQKWFQTPTGQALLQQERALIEKAIPNLFGYYLVQIGAAYPSPESLLDASRIPHKVLLDQQHTLYPGMLFVQADLDYLPVQKESVDVVFLPHTLESVEDPYHLLRQVDRMLVPEGHIVITGFNPYGCAILRQRVKASKTNFKEAHLMKMERIVDWLNLLGYDIELAQYSQVTCLGLGEGEQSVSYRWMEKFERGLEKMGMHLGNVYVLVARKRVDSPKPVGLDWRLANWLPVNKGVRLSTGRNLPASNRKNHEQ
jgi:SAM-dependent methyltransferase